MQEINWYLSVVDTNKLIGNKKQIRNNGKNLVSIKKWKKLMEISRSASRLELTFLFLTFELEKEILPCCYNQANSNITDSKD